MILPKGLKKIERSEVELRKQQEVVAHLILDNYAASLLQASYARLFKSLNEADIDRVLSSFARKYCQPNRGLLDIISNHLVPENLKDASAVLRS